jgi:hypothetical protein
MEMSGQFHAPTALSPGKVPQVPIGYEAGRAPEPFFSLPGLELQVLGLPAYIQSLYRLSYGDS